MLPRLVLPVRPLVGRRVVGVERGVGGRVFVDETQKRLAVRLGHRDPDTTLRYTHFDDAMSSAAVECVAKAMKV